MNPAERQHIDALLLAVRRSWIALAAMALAASGFIIAVAATADALIWLPFAVIFLAGLAWWGSAAIRLHVAIKRVERSRR